MENADLFSQLTGPVLRRFVPEQFDSSDWDQMEPLFKDLESRNLEDLKSLQRWIEDQFELQKVIEQEGGMAFIRMTVDTTNEEFENAYLHFVEEIRPRITPRWNKLNQMLLENEHTAHLPDRYGLMLKCRRNAVALFRQENVELEAEEAKLDQQHDKIKGSQTALFDGKEQTLIQIGTYLEGTDRALRKEAFATINGRRLEDKDDLGNIFEQLVSLRHRRAKNAGYSNFRDFQFQRLERFDYSPDHCFDFHMACEQRVMPAVRELARRRRELLQVESLRPWDLAVDPTGKEPLQPFETVGDLTQGCFEIFQKVDARLGHQFEQLMDLELLDLDNRKGKAPGGYQATLDEYHLPFIFMNAVGRDGDLRTMLHEAGHAFHTFATTDEPILDYQHAPMEFCEVASMTMELIANQHLEVFYTQEEATRSRRQHLEGILELLPWIATIDAFQHWIYTHPGHSSEERQTHWMELRDRFSDQSDWSGFEEAQKNLWQRQGHLFGVPFYYIEYGIAQLGALGIWINAKSDSSGALEAYLKSLSKGGSIPLPDLFQTAGIKFDFGPETVAPLVDAVMNELDA